jgi:polysaccharide export outer membrane protein
MKKLHLILIVIASSIGFTSCINQSIMLRTEKDYSFDIPDDTIKSNGYIIQPNDLFFFRLYANDGFKLIDISNQGQAAGGQMMGGGQNIAVFSYLVEQDSTCKLPVLGNIKIAGKTVREAELFLQEKYAYSFNDPFVQLFVNNRRVFVFPGSYGNATVIQLNNNNTTIIEVLARAGGVAEFGKAQKVKLIRKTGDQNNPLVYEFDLSTIEGLKYANMLVRTEDIIYVEPRKRVVSNVLKEITPFVSILTTVLLTITTLQALSALNK